MKRVIVLLNLVAAVLVVPAIWGSSMVVGLRLKSNYTELDREQVIDQKTLGEFADHWNLNLQPNDRHKVPMWMFEPVTFYRLVGIPCTLAFLLNALLVGIFWKRRQPITLEAEQNLAQVSSESALSDEPSR